MVRMNARLALCVLTALCGVVRADDIVIVVHRFHYSDNGQLFTEPDVLRLPRIGPEIVN